MSLPLSTSRLNEWKKDKLRLGLASACYCRVHTTYSVSETVKGFLGVVTSVDIICGCAKTFNIF